jgi:hypothetical protein
MKMKLLFTVVLLMFSAVSMAQSSQLETREPPKFSPAKEHKPLATAKANQRVAVLNILLTYEKGEVVGAKLVRSQKIASVAPKVFARQMGDWQVMIGDNQKNAFFVNDPGFLEAENKPGDKVPYHYVSRGDEVEWDLVVPLYKNGEAIDASTITIKRVKDGKVILQTKI